MLKNKEKPSSDFAKRSNRFRPSTRFCGTSLATELVEIYEEANGNTCPTCRHVNYKRPVSFTPEGAAEFFCDGCESFYKDLDVFPEDEDE